MATPVLPLPHPLLLLPSSKVTFPVSRQVGVAIVELVQQFVSGNGNGDQGHPLIAAAPIINEKDNHITLNEFATLARIVRIVRPNEGGQAYTISLHGLSRVRLPSTEVSTESVLPTMAVLHPSNSDLQIPPRNEIDDFKSSALRMLERLNQAQENAKVQQPGRRDAWAKFMTMVEEIGDHRVGWLADLLVGAINVDYTDRLEYLSTPTVSARLSTASKIFIKHTSITEVSQKIQSAVDESLSKQQKEFFLRQQLAAIQRELSTLTRSNPSSPASSNSSTPTNSPKTPVSELDEDDSNNMSNPNAEDRELAEIKRKVELMATGSEERKTAVREWRRLKRIPQGSVEWGVVRTYLEWLTALPWPNSTEPQKAKDNTSTRAFLAAARAQLDADHYGLDKVKKRLIEYLAVLRLRETQRNQDEVSSTPSDSDKSQQGSSKLPETKTGKVKGPILLFVGPPGTGKTSLASSIALSLGRPFARIALGGVRDEAEIRGHRRTYVASAPGRIVQALRKTARLDPVLCLDEIDKVGHNNFHGDPEAALLEVLDPEQNHSFNDHYINVPIDLSQTLFICTANTIDSISPPLLDRCEVIHLAGYTTLEKLAIAKRFLLPKQLRLSGLPPEQLDVTEDAIRGICELYTREAGVRGLERVIGNVVRKKVVEWIDCAEDKSKTYNPVVTRDSLELLLGIPPHSLSLTSLEERGEKPGVVYGLVVMGQGEGGVLAVETTKTPGTGEIKLTGSLGDVIKESASLAFSWVKTHAYALNITSAPTHDPLKYPESIDVHLHLPAGSQKKDGPSAGVAMVCAFVSLLTGTSVPSNIAMTGEITLRGHVTPVGGIKEKVLGAHRAQITKVILPYANRKDVEQDVPEEIKREMEFVFVKTVEEALRTAFGGKVVWREQIGGVIVESRL